MKNSYFNKLSLHALCKLSLVTKSRISQGSRISALSRLHSVDIGSYSYVKEEARLSYVKIGNYSSIGPRVSIISGLHDITLPSTSPWFVQSTSNNRHIPDSAFKTFADINLPDTTLSSTAITLISDDVWIGANVSIFSGIRLGRGCVIGACSLVTRDVPAYSICYGSPAKVVRYRFSPSFSNKLEESRWWTFQPFEAHHIIDSLMDT